jgi:hypothetical protein
MWNETQEIKLDVHNKIERNNIDWMDSVLLYENFLMEKFELVYVKTVWKKSNKQSLCLHE